MTVRAFFLALTLAVTGTAGAVPYPQHGRAPAATDVGATSAVAASAPITVTVALTLGNAAQVEPLLEALYT